MAPATTAVVNALPVAKAGDGSSVNQITRQVGGAFGVAIIGTVFASVYAARLDDALSDVPPKASAAAENSLGGAIGAANQIGGAAGDRLVEQATRAFDAGAQFGLAVAAALALLGAIVAAVTVRSGQNE